MAVSDKCLKGSHADGERSGRSSSGISDSILALQHPQGLTIVLHTTTSQGNSAHLSYRYSMEKLRLIRKRIRATAMGVVQRAAAVVSSVH